MFDGINQSTYNLTCDLHKAMFLRDCLYEEIHFCLKDGDVLIYKTLQSGISEEISLDKLIYFIQTEKVKRIPPAPTPAQRAAQEEASRVATIAFVRAQQGRSRPGPIDLEAGARAIVEERARAQALQDNRDTYHMFVKLFGSIPTIREATENMKLLLKYGDQEDGRLKI